MQEFKEYKINNSTVKLIFGNLLSSTADVLVISGSVGLPMRGGLPEVVRKLAGETVLDDATKHPFAKLGDVVVTSAGNLPNKYLFHAITVADYREAIPHLNNDDNPQVYEYIIGYAISKSMRLLTALDLNSIAFPCLGLGVANLPLNGVAKITAKNIVGFLKRTNKSISVEIYIYDCYDIYKKFDYLPFFEWFATYTNIHQHDLEQEHTKDTEKEITFDNVEISDPTAKDTPKPQVFISYSRQDTEAAKGICNLLNQMQIPYWIDINGVFSGSNFKQEIVNAISNSEIVLFLSSHNSNMSSNVAKEVSIADKFKKVIIPIRLDASPMNPKIEYDLVGIDFVDMFYFDENSIVKLKNAIWGHLAMNNSAQEAQRKK